MGRAGPRFKSPKSPAGKNAKSKGKGVAGGGKAKGGSKPAMKIPQKKKGEADGDVYDLEEEQLTEKQIKASAPSSAHPAGPAEAHLWYRRKSVRRWGLAVVLGKACDLVNGVALGVRCDVSASAASDIRPDTGLAGLGPMEATQRQNDSFLSQLPCKSYLTSVGD